MKMKKADDLYVMCNSLLPTMYKVGRAADPQKRACQLMASQPFRMKVVVVFPEFGFIERTIHKSLEAFRVRTGPGVEWFQCEISTIVARILTRLPTYLPQLLAERGRHAVQSLEGEPVICWQDETASTGSSLGAAGVSPVHDMGALFGFATDGSGSPREVVPDGRQLPVLGKVGVGVLAVGQEAAMKSLDDFAFREQPRADVLEGPETGSVEFDELERLSDETIGPL